MATTVNNLPTLKHFKFWCYKVLPLVYDNSLSYYEVLCKVVDYINHLIEDHKLYAQELESAEQAIAELQNWVKEFDTSYVIDIVEKFIANMIYVWISDAGYIVYYIPESWDDIQFNTTGYDIQNAELSDQGHVANFDYGHLVLSMYVNN